MPYTGKPSGACRNLRRNTTSLCEVHKNQQRYGEDVVNAIIVMNRVLRQNIADTPPHSVCPGYTEGLDLILRSQNEAAKASVGRREKQRSRTHSPDVIVPSSPSLLQGLAEQEDAHSLCFFISSWVDYTPDPQSERGFAELIPFLYPTAKLGSPLSLCVATISQLVFNKWEHKIQKPETFSVKRLYGKTLASISEALRDPLASLTDETLMAVCLLGWYEACVAAFDATISSPRHFEGAAALIDQRQGFKMTDLAKRMLVGVRSNLAYRAIQKSAPIDLNTKTWQELDGMQHTPASLLDLMIVEAANLLSMAHQDPKSIPLVGEEDKVKLLDESILTKAMEVNAQLSSWPSATPSDWMPTPVSVEHIPGSVVEAGFYGETCMVYKDVIICSTWNDWRVARLKVLALIARSTHGEERAAATTSIQELADDVCASVPFCLGSRNTLAPLHAEEIAYPTLPGQKIPKLHYRTAVAYGGWYLFAPMKQVMAVAPYLREGQTTWMGLQLQRLGRIYDVAPAN